jgi:uncharacterized phage protein (TIGR01671 family)
MKEIKFRCWDIGRKEWMDSIWLNGDGVQSGTSFDFNRSLNEQLRHDLTTGIALMQYTGLKDKNGKEIYDGDILTCEGGYEAPEGEEICQDISQVYWDNDLLQFRVQCKCGDVWSLEEYDYEEIIGNIYENPELLQSN